MPEFELLTGTVRNRWSPLQLMDMLELVREKATTGVIQGEPYKFKYYVDGEFWFQHAKNDVPCGYKHVNKLEADLAGMML